MKHSVDKHVMTQEDSSELGNPYMWPIWYMAHWTTMFDTQLNHDFTDGICCLVSIVKCTALYSFLCEDDVTAEMVAYWGPHHFGSVWRGGGGTAE